MGTKTSSMMCTLARMQERNQQKVHRLKQGRRTTLPRRSPKTSECSSLLLRQKSQTRSRKKSSTKKGLCNREHRRMRHDSTPRTLLEFVYNCRHVNLILSRLE